MSLMYQQKLVMEKREEVEKAQRVLAREGEGAGLRFMMQERAL